MIKVIFKNLIKNNEFNLIFNHLIQNFNLIKINKVGLLVGNILAKLNKV